MAVKPIKEFAIYKLISDPAHPKVKYDYWEGPFKTKREALKVFDKDYREYGSRKDRPVRQYFVVAEITTTFITGRSLSPTWRSY